MEERGGRSLRLRCSHKEHTHHSCRNPLECSQRGTIAMPMQQGGPSRSDSLEGGDGSLVLELPRSRFEAGSGTSLSSLRSCRSRRRRARRRSLRK